MSSRDIFIGTAGVYYVMSQLSVQGLHAAATHGNAPDFDILVSNSAGDKSVAIQVKSAHWAGRKKGFDFPLSYRAAKMDQKTFLIAFVDFGVNENSKPDIYLVPSSELCKECKPWIDKYEGKLIRFKPTYEWMNKFKIENSDWVLLKKMGIVGSESSNCIEEENETVKSTES